MEGPEGKNTPKTREGRSSKDERRSERREIKLLGGFGGAHESAFAREQYLNKPDFVLCKLFFQAQPIFIKSADQ